MDDWQDKGEIKKNEDIGLIFIYIILCAASTASLLFFAVVIVEARKAKKRYSLHAAPDRESNYFMFAL